MVFPCYGAIEIVDFIIIIIIIIMYETILMATTERCVEWKCIYLTQNTKS